MNENRKFIRVMLGIEKKDLIVSNEKRGKSNEDYF
jgi:hypothetical protein